MPGTGLQVVVLSSGALLYACFPSQTCLDTLLSCHIFSAAVFLIVITQNNLQKSYSHRIPQMLYIPTKSIHCPHFNVVTSCISKQLSDLPKKTQAITRKAEKKTSKDGLVSIPKNYEQWSPDQWELLQNSLKEAVIFKFVTVAEN